MDKTSLGDRMKAYEHVSRSYFTKRMPLLIRVDGKAFHTFTKGLEKPFSAELTKTMQATAMYLATNIQGCKLAYIQSDEISLLLTDYENLNTDAWFGKNLQKIVSVSASMATLEFNRTWKIFTNYYKDLYRSKDDRAIFDSRAWTIPKEEVCNYFIWRQQDATRNSISMVAQYEFSHKELQNKSSNEMQDMLFNAGINWNDITITNKRGSCVRKFNDEWNFDGGIPIFTENRNYIENLI